jgi:hypothetical protein
LPSWLAPTSAPSHCVSIAIHCLPFSHLPGVQRVFLHECSIPPLPSSIGYDYKVSKQDAAVCCERKLLPALSEDCITLLSQLGCRREMRFLREELVAGRVLNEARIRCSYLGERESTQMRQRFGKHTAKSAIRLR